MRITGDERGRYLESQVGVPIVGELRAPTGEIAIVDRVAASRSELTCVITLLVSEQPVWVRTLQDLDTLANLVSITARYAGSGEVQPVARIVDQEVQLDDDSALVRCEVVISPLVAGDRIRLDVQLLPLGLELTGDLDAAGIGDAASKSRVFFGAE